MGNEHDGATDYRGRYEAMVASGEITPADRLVLIEGRLVKKMTKYPPHTMATNMAMPIWRFGAGRLAAGRKFRSAFPIGTASPSPMSRCRGVRSGPTQAGIRTRATLCSSSKSRIRASLTTRLGGDLRRSGHPGLLDRQPRAKARSKFTPIRTRPKEVGGYRSRVDYRPGEDVPVVIDGKEVGRIAVADLLP